MALKTSTYRIETVEAVWLDESRPCSLDELVDLSGLSHAELKELVELGAIEADAADGASLIFQQRYVAVARSARRLKDDFELDTTGLGVAVRLLQRIQELEAELNAARAQLMHGKLSSDTAA
ncbi:MAG: chaperone modulator CbpM [Pseudomonadota bacterium]